MPEVPIKKRAPDAQPYADVLQEYDVFAKQRETRRDCLKELEQHAPDTSSAYISFFCSEQMGASIDSDDIPAFGDILMSVGEVDELNLIINSPGGEGTVAEKIIELCRAYCKRFRVIVPNRAKSAATIIALGADEIVMGYCSELGPIDAQVPVVIGGVVHYVSAQSFIESREDLEDRYRDAIKKKEDPKPILQQIAALDPAFINHCGKLMDFGRDVARKYLAKYMFSGISPKKKQNQAIERVLNRLSSVSINKVHGRMIDGNTAKTELNLNAKLLGRDDGLWKAIWTYYVRADVLLGRGPVAKLIESKSEFLIRTRGVA